MVDAIVTIDQGSSVLLLDVLYMHQLLLMHAGVHSVPLLCSIGDYYCVEIGTTCFEFRYIRLGHLLLL